MLRAQLDIHMSLMLYKRPKRPSEICTPTNTIMPSLSCEVRTPARPAFTNCLDALRSALNGYRTLGAVPSGYRYNRKTASELERGGGGRARTFPGRPDEGVIARATSCSHQAKFAAWCQTCGYVPSAARAAQRVTAWGSVPVRTRRGRAGIRMPVTAVKRYLLKPPRVA